MEFVSHLLHQHQETRILRCSAIARHSKELESVTQTSCRVLPLPVVFVLELAGNLVEVASSLKTAVAKLTERQVSLPVFTLADIPAGTLGDKGHEDADDKRASNGQCSS